MTRQPHERLHGFDRKAPTSARALVGVRGPAGDHTVRPVMNIERFREQHLTALTPTDLQKRLTQRPGGQARWSTRPSSKIRPSTLSEDTNDHQRQPSTFTSDRFDLDLVSVEAPCVRSLASCFPNPFPCRP